MLSRKLEEKVFKSLMIVSLVLVLTVFASILIVVMARGIPALNLKMLIQTPQGGYYLGGAGGIANAIVGSLYLALGSSLLAILLGLPIAFALQKEFTGPRLAGLTRFSLDLMWGTPSIVFGAFGFIVMQALGLRASLLGGIIALALLMLPVMTRAIDEVIQMVPLELKEVSYSMGTTRFETIQGVVFRQAVPGIVTAILLAFGRGIGDAASLLFTAGYTDHIPRSLFDPVASLPLAVFFQLGTPFPLVQQRAYASAVVLLFIVLMVSLVSRFLSRRYSKNVIR